MTALEPAHRICVGRFDIALPPELQMAGRSQSIYGVDVNAPLLTHGGFDTFWQQRLDRLRAERGFRGEVALEDGARGVWMNDGEGGVRLDAARAFGDYVFTTSRSGDEGREAVIQKLSTNVIAAYRPDASAGFCVEHGVITSEPGDAESTSLLASHKRIGELNIRYLTQTVADPVPDERLSDIREMQQSLPGTKLQRIASLRRSVAGISGREERVAMSPPSEPPVVRFTWKCSGESFRADIPHIMIVGVAPKEHQSELAAVWDVLLDSIRKVPMAPGSVR